MAKKKKDSDYFDSPLDHPDVDRIKELKDEDKGIKYSDKEIRFKNETGLDGPEMSKQRKRAKKYVDLVQGTMARKRTAKEGSFKNGGRVVGIAKRGFGRALKRK